MSKIMRRVLLLLLTALVVASAYLWFVESRSIALTTGTPRSIGPIASIPSLVMVQTVDSTDPKQVVIAFAKAVLADDAKTACSLATGKDSDKSIALLVALSDEAKAARRLQTVGSQKFGAEWQNIQLPPDICEALLLIVASEPPHVAGDKASFGDFSLVKDSGAWKVFVPFTPPDSSSIISVSADGQLLMLAKLTKFYTRLADNIENGHDKTMSDFVDDQAGVVRQSPAKLQQAPLQASTAKADQPPVSQNQVTSTSSATTVLPVSPPVSPPPAITIAPQRASNTIGINSPDAAAGIAEPAKPSPIVVLPDSSSTQVSNSQANISPDSAAGITEPAKPADIVAATDSSSTQVSNSQANIPPDSATGITEPAKPAPTVVSTYSSSTQVTNSQAIIAPDSATGITEPTKPNTPQPSPEGSSSQAATSQTQLPPDSAQGTLNSSQPGAQRSPSSLIKSPDDTGHQFSIAPGTTLEVTTIETIDPANFDPGQEYGAILTASIIDNGHVVVPKGTDVTLKAVGRHSLTLVISSLKVHGNLIHVQTEGISVPNNGGDSSGQSSQLINSSSDSNGIHLSFNPAGFLNSMSHALAPKKSSVVAKHIHLKFQVTRD